MPPDLCLTEGCNHHTRTRGICDTCYGRLLNRVKKGLGSWKQFEVEGLCLPIKKRHRGWAKKKRINKEIAAILKEMGPRERDRSPRCPHDKNDGECPDCEREQRQGMVFSDYPNCRREAPVKMCRVLGVVNKVRRYQV